MLKYPVKIILALGETFSGNKEIYNWLLKNGYPELAAFSSAVRGSEDAFDFLMKRGYPQLAALDGAIDMQQGAIQWLEKHKFVFELRFAALCNKQDTAIKYFRSKDLKVFMLLADKINAYRDSNKGSIFPKIRF
ncbi:MAG: hypothetical protein ACEPOV_12320 [Hyphomicrobiales bacterium]